jgi:hypothetical protein
MATKKTATDLFGITNDLLDERLLSTNHYLDDDLDDDLDGVLADLPQPPATGRYGAGARSPSLAGGSGSGSVRWGRCSRRPAYRIDPRSTAGTPLLAGSAGDGTSCASSRCAGSAWKSAA